jgi:polysaccharide biosynthesis protein PslJ
LTATATQTARDRRLAAITTDPVRLVDFEPSLVTQRVYETRRRRMILDVSALLMLMLCLLYLIPEGLILPNLNVVGRPALLIALLLFTWWVLARLSPWLSVIGPQPLRWFALIYLITLLLSYLAGMLRGLNPKESNGEDTALLAAAQILGVMLASADGIRNWERLNAVLRTLVWCAGVMAVVGILQSALHTDVTIHFHLPGLQLVGAADLENRGTGQFRVASFTLHFIEFGALMAMAVPYAIHYARFATKPYQRRLALAVALLCAGAVPMSISRTGVLCLVIALVVMVPMWPWRLRYHAFLALVALVGCLMMIKPGLIGTVKSMFTGASTDPSVTGRTSRYSLIGDWFHQRPWLGRGPFSVVPGINGGIVFDNEWLYLVVTVGIIGTAAVALLHISGIVLASISFRRSREAEVRHLCAAFISTQLICILAEGTFDAFYFTTFTSTMALLLGCTGAVWRFTHPQRTVRTSSVRRFIG